VQPKFLIHDNDKKYGQFGYPFRVEYAGELVSCRSAFDAWLWEGIGIHGIPIPYGAPNAAAHIERLIGSFVEDNKSSVLWRSPLCGVRPDHTVAGTLSRARTQHN
jgi:hypothetical protein